MTPNPDASTGTLAAAAREAKTALDNGWIEASYPDEARIVSLAEFVATDEPLPAIESLTDEQLVEELHGYNPMGGYLGWLGHNRRLDTTAERQALRDAVARYRALDKR